MVDGIPKMISVDVLKFKDAIDALYFKTEQRYCRLSQYNRL